MYNWYLGNVLKRFRYPQFPKDNNDSKSQMCIAVGRVDKGVFISNVDNIYYLNNSRCLNSSSQNILITGHKIIRCVFSNIFQEVLGRIGQLKFISSLISLLNSSRFPKIFFRKRERKRKTYVNSKSPSEY